MAQRSIFDTPTVPRLLKLLEEVRSGAIQIPKFQRPFEWDDERRLDLLDSIARGIPIGSFLVWQTHDHELDCYTSLGGFELPSGEHMATPRRYLLDGHQRLSTLFAALNWGEPTLNEDARLSPIFFDLNVPPKDRPFTFHRRAGEPPGHLISMSSLLNSRKRWEAINHLREEGRHDDADRVEELASVFIDYQIPIIPLISEDLDMVTDSFVRINQRGMRMKEHHMLQALVFSSRFRVRARLEEIQDRLTPNGWGDIDEQLILNTLKVRWGMDVYNAGARAITAKLKQREESEGDNAYEAIFSTLEANLRAGICFLASHCGVRGTRALPYAYQLVALAEVCARHGGELPEDTVDDVRRWFWLTSYTSWFTGMSGKQIRDSIEHLDAVVRGEAQARPDEMPDVAQPLTSYNVQAVRTKAFVLMLTHEQTDDAARLRVQRELGLLGSRTIHKLAPGLPTNNPAAYIVCPSEEVRGVREALRGDVDDDRPRLQSHLISPEAARAWRESDPDAFLRIRRALIEERERAFLTQLGLHLDAPQ